MDTFFFVTIEVSTDVIKQSRLYFFAHQTFLNSKKVTGFAKVFSVIQQLLLQYTVNVERLVNYMSIK